MKKNANILLKMHQKEARCGITRRYVDGGIGITLKVIYIIAFAYTMLINAIYLISVNLNTSTIVENIGKENLSVSQEDMLAEINNSIVFVIIMSVLLIGGMVCLAIKRFTPALLLSCIPCVLLVLHFAERMSETLALNGLACSYTYNHLVPLALIFITALIYCIIGIRFIISENKAYTAFVAGLYDAYSDRIENITEEEWKKFLSEYEPPKKEKLKRSLKAAQRKQAQIEQKEETDEQ